MDAKDIQQIKPFKLVKYFTFTSLIVILLGSLVLSMVIARRAEEVLLKKSEDYALLMAENLNHQVFLQFIIPAALQFGQVIQLRNKVLFERLDQVVRNTLHSFNVDMVNIFDLKQNVIFYSFDKELVGRKGLGDIDYVYSITIANNITRTDPETCHVATRDIIHDGIVLTTYEDSISRIIDCVVVFNEIEVAQHAAHYNSSLTVFP